MTGKGFTLIELLIVVAIIAVLAAIAVPNFLEAQTRAKVSRIQTDQRVIYLACETYLLDHNRYPQKSSLATNGWWQPQLTTPVAYMSSTCSDICCRDGSQANKHYQYGYCPMMKSIMMDSVGPDGRDDWDEAMWMCGKAKTYPIPYDSTNGTVSRGDIYRVSKQGGPVPKLAF
jgi:type II secretion system protein G